NGPSGRTATINYASSNGTATAGSDYTAVSGTLTFPPGVTSRPFVVPIANDMIDESDETVRLYLSTPTNAVLGAQSSATLLILDDDPPLVSFTTNKFLVNEAAGSASISVQLSTPFAQTIFVDYVTSDGTATAGSDYLAASGTLIFVPGLTNKSFLVNVLNDALPETNETVLLALTNLVNATLGQFTSAMLTIVDDDGGAARLGSLSWHTNTGFHFTLSGPQGRSYAIDASSNLVNWLEISRITNTTGTVDFTDPAAISSKKLFYRARQTN